MKATITLEIPEPPDNVTGPNIKLVQLSKDTNLQVGKKYIVYDDSIGGIGWGGLFILSPTSEPKQNASRHRLYFEIKELWPMPPAQLDGYLLTYVAPDDYEAELYGESYAYCNPRNEWGLSPIVMSKERLDFHGEKPRAKAHKIIPTPPEKFTSKEIAIETLKSEMEKIREEAVIMSVDDAMFSVNLVKIVHISRTIDILESK